MIPAMLHQLLKQRVTSGMILATPLQQASQMEQHGSGMTLETAHQPRNRLINNSGMNLDHLIHQLLYTDKGMKTAILLRMDLVAYRGRGD